jgi:hypothetical protein
LGGVCSLVVFASWSESTANPQRSYRGGVLGELCGVLRRAAIIVIHKKAKIRVPLFRKKSGIKWDLMTITITIGIHALLSLGG